MVNQFGASLYCNRELNQPKVKNKKMKDGLYIGTTGFMTLYVNGVKMNLVHIPIFSENSTHAIVSYTPGEPGIDEELHDEVPIFRS